MQFTEALEVIQDVQNDFGEGLLETLMYMQSNLDDFSDKQVRAYRVVFNEMRKLFIKE